MSKFTIKTAQSASHPEQGPDHRGARGMSGRPGNDWANVQGPSKRMGGAPVRPNFLQKPAGKTGVMKPNGGSFKPHAGKGKLDPIGGRGY